VNAANPLHREVGPGRFASFYEVVPALMLERRGLLWSSRRPRVFS
jgi:hypothetical protein